MRALAETLGVYPTAVYWHAGNKGELLNAVANAVLEEVTLPDEGLPWTRWLSEFARRFREAVQRHPNTAPLLGGTLLLTPALLPGLEGVLRRLESIGFGGQELVQAYNAYFGYVVGYTINELSQKPEDVSHDWETLAEDYLGNLSPGTYPTIVENLQLLKNHAIAFRWISCQDSALLNSYEFGLEALLAGLEQMANGIAEQRASG
jgi:TetR/AcrR family transcriptional regulator, tetracycline repressor protein